MKSTGIATFGALAVIIFFGFIYLILGGVLDMVALASIPVILCAEVIVLGMFYATVYHSKAEQMAATSIVAPIEPRKPAAMRKVQHVILSSPTQMVKS